LVASSGSRSGAKLCAGELRRRQRLLVEPRRNLVALLRLASLSRSRRPTRTTSRLRIPPRLAWTADAAGKKDGQIYWLSVTP